MYWRQIKHLSEMWKMMDETNLTLLMKSLSICTDFKAQPLFCTFLLHFNNTRSGVVLFKLVRDTDKCICKMVESSEMRSGLSEFYINHKGRRNEQQLFASQRFKNIISKHAAMCLSLKSSLGSLKAVCYLGKAVCFEKEY